MERFTDSQTWWIIFDRSYGTKKWWQRLLNRDFQHVHLVRELTEDTTLMVNSFHHTMAVKLYPNEIGSFIDQELSQNPTAILQMTVHYGSHYKPMPLEPLTCVTVAKRILGIRNTWIITPRQLYRECIKAGAQIVKPYCITY